MKSNRQIGTPGQKHDTSEGVRLSHSLAPISPVARWSSRLFSNRVIAVLLGGLVLAVFQPVVRHDFINLDDLTYVLGNYHVQPGLTKQGLSWAFTSFQGANWHPLTWMSHMLDCQLFGLNPAGHHLTSALLHAINSMLLFLFLKGVTGAVWRSLAVAALFGLHPLRVESVAWVSERKDVLSTLFFILTLWAYTRYARKAKTPAENRGLKVPGLKRCNPDYCLAWLCFVLGLMSKPMIVTVPFVLLLLDYWPLARFEPSSPRSWPRPAVPSFWRLVAEKVPFLCLSVADCVITFLAQRQAGTVEPTTALGFALRLENAAIAYVCYLGKMFYPARLAVFYPRASHFPVAAVVFAVLLMFGLSALAFTQRRQRPYFLVGWFWFVGTLIPVIGLVQVGTQAMADRYTYIPCIGILVLLSWGVAELTGMVKLTRILVAGAWIAAIFLSVALTRYQLGFWRDSETLFRHALQITKDNFVAHDSLADALSDSGLTKEAEQEYREALRLRPTYVAAHNRLGLLLKDEGKFDEAIAHYTEALKTSPENAELLVNLGDALCAKGSLDQAIACFEEVLAADPSHPQAHEDLANALLLKGDVGAAIPHFRVALRIVPQYGMGHHNLAVALLSQGKVSEAIEHLREAVQLEPDLVAAHSVLGAALLSQGSRSAAEAQFREVLRRKPQDGYALDNLGAILVGQGRLEEAVSVLQGTVSLYPEDADAHLNLGRALASQGKTDAAIGELRTAARLRPGDERAKQILEAIIPSGVRTNGP